jgi:hypothetical protein
MAGNMTQEEYDACVKKIDFDTNALRIQSKWARENGKVY